MVCRWSCILWLWLGGGVVLIDDYAVLRSSCRYCDPICMLAMNIMIYRTCLENLRTRFPAERASRVFPILRNFRTRGRHSEIAI